MGEALYIAGWWMQNVVLLSECFVAWLVVEHEVQHMLLQRC
jgi:hypothetical protein